MPEQTIPGVPTAVAAVLDRLTQELSQAAGPNLAGLILYGGLARGRFRTGTSDVNIVVLLHDASAEALLVIAPALRAAWRAASVEPMILTPGEVAKAADVFPIKFLDIKEHHIVLTGQDPFAAIEVSPEHLRLHVKQELHNLLLRLRRRYIAAHQDSALLTRVLASAARPFALQLAVLLRLAGKEVPKTDRTTAIYEAAAAAFGLASEPLTRLAALRQNPRASKDIVGLVPGVLGALAQATDIADRMKEVAG